MAKYRSNTVVVDEERVSLYLLAHHHQQHQQTMSNHGEQAHIVSPDKRDLYGLRTMEILATNQPVGTCLDTSHDTFTPCKDTFAIKTNEFSPEICDRLAQYLLAHPSIPTKCEWALHVFRLGFESRDKNPIVVHLCVTRDYLSDTEACQLVDEMARIISDTWKGEKVYVDICQESLFAVEAGNVTRNATGGVDLVKDLSRFFEFTSPCPGLSIGPEDRPQCAGTVTGLIEHHGITYVLTNCHVLNSSDEILGQGPYKFKEGDRQFMAVVPAACDYDATMKAISNERELSKSHVQRIQKQMIPGVPCKGLQATLDYYIASSEFWEETFKRAEQHNSSIGQIVATSGVDESAEFHNGCIDWSIVQTRLHGQHNKHPERSYLPSDNNSGFQLRIEDRDLIRKWAVDHDLPQGWDKEFIRNATNKIDGGPNYEPLQTGDLELGGLYIKPGSRSLGWRPCVLSAIKAERKNKKDQLTKENCFVGHGMIDVVSAKGDSGALILDKEFRPVAMLWGGHKVPGFKDMTYATPLTAILRDIERQMNWDQGSVRYL